MKRLTTGSRRGFLALQPDAPVRLWSMQHPAALDEARARGFLTGEHPFRYMREPEEDVETGFQRAYDWMRERMAEYVPSFSGDLPIWSWLRRINPRREHKGHRMLRITSVVPRARILASDFDLWHTVLNGYPVLWSDEEWGQWDRGQAIHDIQSSWDAVFDLSPRLSKEVQAWIGQPDRVQVCVDRIYMHEITSVREVGWDDQRNQGRGRKGKSRALRQRILSVL